MGCLQRISGFHARAHASENRRGSECEEEERRDGALNWALSRGYTPTAQMLIARSAANNAAIRESAEKAIALLQKERPRVCQSFGLYFLP